MAGLLMTRPLEAAQRFVASLPEAALEGVEVIYAPLISIEPLAGPLDLGPARAVIFTSANGVAAASRETGRRLPAYCVGPRTTAAAAAEGWQAVRAGATAEELVADLVRHKPPGPLLHLRGSHARGEVAQRLAAAGNECREQIVYRQELKPLSARALEALAARDGVIVPLFSPRTARQFAGFCATAPNLHLIALSLAVAEPLKGLNCKALQVCTSPDAGAMAQAVQDAAAGLRRLEDGGAAQ
ncbi:uroporphyrinogen-III synthase [Cribrihabitans pelagius]|uniref:uroporphyrinogen-III synthase n=1 Tax=Cribrihabitans pelagius TaxID=1765746 RepID=UPI003B5A4FD5